MSNDPNDGFTDKQRERPTIPPAEPRSPRRFNDYDDLPPRRPPGGGGGGGGAVKAVLIVLGVVLVVALLCGGGTVALMLYGVGKVRNAAARMSSSNNMKQMSLAIHNYESTYGHMPASLKTKDGKPGLSWRVAILSYMEKDNLYRQFKVDEPWDSPNNIKLLDQMPKFLVNPRMAHPMNQTSYRIFVGGGAMFEHGKKTRLAGFGKLAPDEIGIADGLANTIMIVEATDTVPWTKPDELVFQPNGPLPSMGPAGEDAFMAAFGDGSIKPIPVSTPPASIRAWITANGGEAVLPPP